MKAFASCVFLERGHSCPPCLHALKPDQSVRPPIRPLERRARTPKGVLSLVGSILMCLTATTSAQGPRDLNMRIFKLADGLAESACISVTVAPQGQVLVRHTGTAGISELNGYSINVLPAPGEGNSRIYGSPAGQLWTVSRKGLEEYKGIDWLLHPVAEIAAEFRT